LAASYGVIFETTEGAPKLHGVFLSIIFIGVFVRSRVKEFASSLFLTLLYVLEECYY
jgi:hypothetical protein